MPSPARLEHAAIAALIPHHGAMCLLDSVETWSADAITTFTMAHQRADNPLREHDGLPATVGIELAAQAMAIHGGLLAREQSVVIRPGYLAAVRDVMCSVARLDNIPNLLEVCATRLAGDTVSLMYAFTVRAGHQTLMTGRAIIALQQPDGPDAS
jgi:predicted hotdog family 3-hydroxylacyl-ACP dehydratase